MDLSGKELKVGDVFVEETQNGICFTQIRKIKTIPIENKSDKSNEYIVLRMGSAYAHCYDKTIENIIYVFNIQDLIENLDLLNSRNLGYLATSLFHKSSKLKKDDLKKKILEKLSKDGGESLEQAQNCAWYGGTQPNPLITVKEWVDIYQTKKIKRNYMTREN